MINMIDIDKIDNGETDEYDENFIDEISGNKGDDKDEQ
jgi:hypothetical protein